MKKINIQQHQIVTMKTPQQLTLPLAQIEPSFQEGLSRLLPGLNAATTRNVISAKMAHLIPCNNGSRFVFSHDFSYLLVGQMDATLEGEITNVQI
jgi:hypothetical protein